MYDKYDLPYGEDGMPKQQGQFGEQIAPATDFLKANLKKILFGIIALAVVYFAYDFFIGSYRDVTISIVDTEGKAVKTGVKISDSSGNNVASAQSGQKIKLKIGEYSASIASADYKAVLDYPITVNENATVKIVLEENRDTRVSGELPGTLVSGETKEFAVTITNNESSAQEIELLAEGDLKSDARLDYAAPLNVMPGENTVNLKLEVLGTAKAKEGKSGTIRIKGLGQESGIEGEYDLKNYDDSKLSVKLDGSATTANFDKMFPGQSKSKKITFENRNAFGVDGLKIDFEITDNGFDRDYKIAEWFTLNPKGLVDLGANEKNREATLTLEIPRSLEFPVEANEVSVQGTITVSNNYVKKTFTFQFNVQRPAAKIDLAGIDSIVKIGKKDGKWVPVRDKQMTLSNKGLARLSDIRAKVECNSKGSRWLSIFNEDLQKGDSTSFIAIEAGASKAIPYEIELPAATQSRETSICKISVKYEDPNGPLPLYEKTVTISAE